MTLILGIDDAGRGPVLGPMVLAGVLLKKTDEKKLTNWGAKDSKLLSPAQRAKIQKQIKNNFQTHLEISTPKEIDDSTNLNYLEAQKAAKIINTLTKNQKEKIEVIIDCPSTNTISWNEDVKKLVQNKNIKIKSEHKADLNHPVVSAASIIAKECRELEMKKIKKLLNTSLGSGYPADPTTKEFIQNNFQDPKYKKIIRFSWSTVKKLEKAADPRQRKLF